VPAKLSDDRTGRRSRVEERLIGVGVQHKPLADPLALERSVIEGLNSLGLSSTVRDKREFDSGLVTEDFFLESGLNCPDQEVDLDNWLVAHWLKAEGRWSLLLVRQYPEADEWRQQFSNRDNEEA